MSKICINCVANCLTKFVVLKSKFYDYFFCFFFKETLWEILAILLNTFPPFPLVDSWFLLICMAPNYLLFIVVVPCYEFTRHNPDLMVFAVPWVAGRADRVPSACLHAHYCGLQQEGQEDCGRHLPPADHQGPRHGPHDGIGVSVLGTLQLHDMLCWMIYYASILN